VNGVGEVSGPVRPWVPRTARVLLLLAVLLAAAFTVGGRPTEETDLFARVLRGVLAFTPLSPDRLSTPRVEFVANIVLFLPLGVLLPPAFPRAPLTLLLVVPVLTSLGIEVAQLLVLQGRVPDAVDVLANSTGGAVGLLVGADLLRLARRRRG
jgi:glycopeptide antibiotics resistance protein